MEASLFLSFFSLLPFLCFLLWYFYLDILKKRHLSGTILWLFHIRKHMTFFSGGQSSSAVNNHVLYICFACPLLLDGKFSYHWDNTPHSPVWTSVIPARDTSGLVHIRNNMIINMGSGMALQQLVPSLNLDVTFMLCVITKRLPGAPTLYSVTNTYTSRNMLL